MRHPVLLAVVRALLLALLPAFALPLVVWSGAAAAQVEATEPAPAGVVSAAPAGETTGGGHVVPGPTSARPAPPERVTGAAPPAADDLPGWRAVAAPPLAASAGTPDAARDVGPPRTPGHEPTPGRAPPSVTRT